jgi:FAD-dependent halogenase
MSEQRDDIYDAVVVGGGPGGSTAATFVAMQGHRVLLLEKQAQPAYKIGESLLPATVHGICPMLGVSAALAQANFTIKRGGTFRWGKPQEPWMFEFAASDAMRGVKGTAYQVERMKFDKILLDNAREKGVEVREQHRVVESIVEGGRVVGLEYEDAAGVRGAVRARYVVDASGYQSTLHRLAGERRYSKFFQNVAVFAYFEGAGRLPKPNAGNIFCAAFDEGWFWYIPLSPGLTSVGAVIAKEHASRITRGPEQALSEYIQACPHIRDLLANATRVTSGVYGKVRVRSDYSYSNTRFWTPGLVLIGDAACFVDPVFSSGVHLATYSGLLAARSINSRLAGLFDDERCFEEFEQRYRREYGNFYEFLISFYDANQDLDSYFWKARSVTNSPERRDRAFLDLVGGVASFGEQLYQNPDEYWQSREGLGAELFQQAHGTPVEAWQPSTKQFVADLESSNVSMQRQTRFKATGALEAPLVPGGLVPSPDGLHWIDPGMFAARELVSSEQGATS